MENMQRTNLVWNSYIDYLIDAINGSKFMKRAEDKPMSTPKTAKEIHVTTRAIHLRESADIAKRIAKGLGLNDDYIYASMLLHDAGHPFSAHEGEEIFNQLGEIYNTQNFHHNAKAIEIILSEDICGKAIAKIPNIDNNPELIKKLEEEFPYFLDCVISHDGEANREDMMKQATSYPTIEEAIKTKMKLANSENKYKFVAQTPEGRIAKFADVIAYLSSDMQDGFRLGILKEFSDEYLALFGEMFSTEYPITEKDKIDCGRRIIEQIKKRNLREKRETMKAIEEDTNLGMSLENIIKKIQEQELNIYNEQDAELIQELVENEQRIFKQKRIDDLLKEKEIQIPEEEKQGLEEKINEKLEKGLVLNSPEREFSKILNRVNSEANKIEEFTAKMLRARSSVVYEVTSRMKEYFINDLIKNSQGQDTPQFSNAAWNLFFKAKNLNYKEFVQYTNWDYQTEQLPKAAKELADECSIGLIKSGIIRNKFYDEAVRKHIADADALEYMETVYRPEESYLSYRKEHGIGDLKSFTTTSNRRFTGTKEQQALMKLNHNVYSYVQNEDEVFAIRYQNTFNAIKTRMRKKIEELALDPKVHEEEHPDDSKNLKNKKKNLRNHLYKKELGNQIHELRTEIINRYGSLELTPEQSEEFIAEKTEKELSAMEYKMAIQMSTDYLAGMSDKAFIDLAAETGKLDRTVIRDGARGERASSTVQELIKDSGDSISK